MFTTLLRAYRLPAILIGTLFLGVLIGVIGVRIVSSSDISLVPVAMRSKTPEGQLTNPILDCELYQKDSHSSYKPLEVRLTKQIDLISKRHNIADVAVYFRDMSTGAWIGIGEQTPFSPASLLKVPVMMAYYKIAEKQPGILESDLVFLDDYADEIGILQNILPTLALEPGSPYKIADLLNAMIVRSDNNAQMLLIENLPQAELDAVYLDLGIAIPGIRKTEDFMTVKEYASFFRILYNSTYLSRAYSEEALKLLSQVEFDGLKVGLPRDITVSHKFGERGIPQPGKEEIRQLHDCGIIYEPDKPYLLCVMTRGTDLEDQRQVIADISSFVYDEVGLILHNYDR